MFKNLSILQAASAMSRHAVERQSVIAENIANADTPGFKAKDLEPFSISYAKKAAAIETLGGKDRFRTERISVPGAASPNGNTVSLEDQMARSAAAARDHETAVTLYSKTLEMLRITLGRSR